MQKAVQSRVVHHFRQVTDRLEFSAPAPKRAQLSKEMHLNVLDSRHERPYGRTTYNPSVYGHQ
jgi:hypothetical protein